MDFRGPGKPEPANPAYLPKWAGLAGTGLPGPLKSMYEKKLGINYFSSYKSLTTPKMAGPIQIQRKDNVNQ